MRYDTIGTCSTTVGIYKNIGRQSFEKIKSSSLE